MSTYLEVRLVDLIPNPDNPRETLGDIDDLAASIAAVGVLQRLLVTPADTFTYMVVDGHRRYEAMRSIGYDRPIPVEVRVMDRADRLAAAVAAGSFSRPISPIDQARAFRALEQLGLTRAQIEERTGCNAGSFSRPISPIDQARAFRALEQLGLTRAQIEERTGCNQPMISTRLRLLELTPEQQLAVHEGRMTLSAAKEATYQLGRRAPDRAPRHIKAPTRSTTAPPPPTRPPRSRVVVPLVLMCNDCEYEATPDRVMDLNRHCLEQHRRRATPLERTPVPAR